ncbi:MAG: cytochrome P450 [Acidimicrobiia bacterium]
MATDFDPFDAAQAQNAWPLLAELRREGPVVAIGENMRYVPRHTECRAVLRDTAAFSNASGMKAPGVEIPLEDRILGELDPPRHTAVRRVMVTALTPKLIHAAEPFMRETAVDLLDALPDTGPADLVPAFTIPLPNRVTVHLLGFPPEDADQIAAWAKELMESPFPATNRSDRGEGFANAFPEFAGYIDARIEARAARTTDSDEGGDIVGRLLGLEVDGAPLSRPTVRALVRNLITGGFTTTSQLLGNLLHQLLTNPRLETRVRGDERAIPRVVEESLRISPPVLFVARGCIDGASIGGTEVPAGSRVIVGLASANRDEQVFSDGARFDADRPNADQHVSFGYGSHVCPGASLARVVARAGLEAFFDHFPPGTVQLQAGYEFENVPTFFECGPRRLPIEASSATPRGESS